MIPAKIVFLISQGYLNKSLIDFLACLTDIGAFWFGLESFHFFDGNSVQTLQCDVHDYVFADLFASFGSSERRRSSRQLDHVFQTPPGRPC